MGIMTTHLLAGTHKHTYIHSGTSYSIVVQFVQDKILIINIFNNFTCLQLHILYKLIVQCLGAPYNALEYPVIVYIDMHCKTAMGVSIIGAYRQTNPSQDKYQHV